MIKQIMGGRGEFTLLTSDGIEKEERLSAVANEGCVQLHLCQTLDMRMVSKVRERAMQSARHPRAFTKYHARDQTV